MRFISFVDSPGDTTSKAGFTSGLFRGPNSNEFKCVTFLLFRESSGQLHFRTVRDFPHVFCCTNLCHPCPTPEHPRPGSPKVRLSRAVLPLGIMLDQEVVGGRTQLGVLLQQRRNVEVGRLVSFQPQHRRGFNLEPRLGTWEY